MDALTVVDAHDVVLNHLDDQTGARFAPSSLGTDRWKNVDRALRSLGVQCLDEYVAAGGDRFDEEINVETSDGEVSLAQYAPKKIRSVHVVPASTGNVWHVEAGDRLRRAEPDLVDRDLRLTIVRAHRLPDKPSDSDLLTGTVRGAARSWGAFDEWVCARAAKRLGIKRLEKTRQEQLLAEIGELEQSVLGHPTNNSQVLPLYAPRPRRPMGVFERLRWGFLEREQTLSLFYDGEA